MLAARADLRIDGPGVAVHVHGDGSVLVADVRGEIRSAARMFHDIPGLVRFTRRMSRSLRATGLRVEVRVGGRTIVRLG
ncbi:MAG: hypothetical protein NVS4B13_03680 [Candidatus Elarobacter sp.]